MFRTIAWFIYFWVYLISLLPTYYKIDRMLKAGKIDERDILVYREVSKWAKALLKIAGAKVKVTGAENVPQDRAVLFVSNHQGNFDIPIMMACIDTPKAFVAKIEMLKIPLIRSWMKQMNCVFMDRGDARQSLRVLNEATEYVKQGYSMCIFPEGTRSKGGAMKNFAPGSLRIALKANVAIVPVTIKGSYKLMEQNGFMIKPADVELVISKPIETVGLSKEEMAELHHKVQAIVAEALQ